VVLSEVLVKGAGVAARRRLTILGSTGSVGCNTLAIIADNPEAYNVVALTAYRNVELLARQARATNAEIAVIGDDSLLGDLRALLSDTEIEVASGESAVEEAASRPVEWVMAGIVGAAGLRPTLAAVRQGAVIALANKECLVCAGDIMLQEVAKHGAVLLPADSEHNAIFQVFDFDSPETVARIILTASGGPFLKSSLEHMARATPAEAVAHPNWDMGAKISVDSATMMNKGLEIIEAHRLFPVAPDQIDVLVHPQSVIHSLVAYRDGSTLAQLGPPDMRTPISYTLGWPERIETKAAQLDLATIGNLTFQEPDPVRFPALRLAREALETGGSLPTVLNAANEIAVAAFLDERIGFLRISEIVEETMQRVAGGKIDSLEAITTFDGEARRLALEILE
jgi:1-deoxy-D-xylulose-5-phosphate reductoisomerase